MKIAILLYGQPRFLDMTRKMIKEEFDLPGHTVHYFFHFWNKFFIAKVFVSYESWARQNAPNPYRSKSQRPF